MLYEYFIIDSLSLHRQNDKVTRIVTKTVYNVYFRQLKRIKNILHITVCITDNYILCRWCVLCSRWF